VPTVQFVTSHFCGGGNNVRHHYYTDPDGNTFQLDLPDPEPTPLDPHGQLVTLLVVVGTLTLDDAEHVAGDGITAADLQAEAEAWSLGGA